MRIALRLVALGAIALVTPRLQAQHEGHTAGLGTIVFPNSGNRAAQAPFLRGVALLHSFEYEAAADAFREAQRADPSLALAYWGEALTYSHVVWRTEDLPASRAALKRLAPTRAERLTKARTPRERSFGAAVEAFYQEGTLAQRVRAYAEGMYNRAKLAADDQEAAAFAAHALMLLGYQTEGPVRDAHFGDAIRLAQQVALANPNHPGATHYLIHLYDSPGMAPQGLAFARAYDKIAPDAEHALHMPSHIYLQLGLWDDVAKSNERAWAASRLQDKNAGSLDWHAYSWLHYAYLQLGRWKAAQALIDSARTILAGGFSGYPDAGFVITRLEFQQAAETGKWPAALPRPSGAGEPLSERERGFRQFAQYWLAVDAAQRSDTSLQTLAATHLAIADSVRAGTIASPVKASNALVIEALVARSRGDTIKAFESVRAAADLERKFGPFVGPPERIFAGELLAIQIVNVVRASKTFSDQWRQKTLADASSALENVLRLCPNRTQTLFLLGAVRTAAGDTAGARDVLEKLRVNWRTADDQLRALLQ